MEYQIIIIVSCALGVIAPGALLYAFARGYQQLQWNLTRKKVAWNRLLVGTMVWTILLFLLTLSGLFEYQAGDLFPRFLIGLMIPVSVMLILHFYNGFNEWLNQISIKALVGAQFFRIFGTVFFLVALTGMGPLDFMSSGYGDFLTGLLAIIVSAMYKKGIGSAKVGAWIFNIVGMLDLLNVSFILVSKYPTWSDAVPSTALAGSFPLMLIIGLTAPVALLLHIYTIRALIKEH